eukprot:33521-Alexandrium_andersonii.AAC.1
MTVASETWASGRWAPHFGFLHFLQSSFLWPHPHWEQNHAAFWSEVSSLPLGFLGGFCFFAALRS